MLFLQKAIQIIIVNYCQKYHCIEKINKILKLNNSQEQFDTFLHFSHKLLFVKLVEIIYNQK